MSDNSNNIDEKKNVIEKSSIKSVFKNNTKVKWGLGTILVISLIGFAGSKLYNKYTN